MEDLYRSRFGSRRQAEAGASGAAPGAGADLGVRVEFLRDDQTPDEAMPLRRRAASLGGLRVGHALAPLPRTRPAEGARFGAALMFRDISGARREASKANPVISSDVSGRVRLASNEQTLYRSWGVRRWTVDRQSRASSRGLPYADEDKDKPASFRLAP